jgi:PD-(D/E)XK nuclease superfamily
MIENVLIKSLQSYDSSRDRSNQAEIGPSSAGGCARRVWHELRKDPKINDTSSLAAIMGTFIHAGIAEAIKREDPFGDNFIIEQEWKSEAYNLKGHIDLFIKDQGLVVDWKTKTKAGMRYFPSEQEIWQVQLYGFLAEENGYEVKSVSLCAIARDGSEKDIRSHTEPYNRQIALTALEWLKSINPDGEAPAPEKNAKWCRSYCPYYGEKLCLGMMK